MLSMSPASKDEGLQVLDDLLVLGYHIEISDEGVIIATESDGGEPIEGRTDSGHIEWTNRSRVFKVRQRAYIVHLRAYIQEQRQK